MNSKQRRQALRKQSREMGGECLRIKGWEDLAKLPDSSTHRIEIDLEMGCGHVFCKEKPSSWHYLSTHTFYGSQYRYSTQLLRECGFNVLLDNWDAANVS